MSNQNGSVSSSGGTGGRPPGVQLTLNYPDINSGEIGPFGFDRQAQIADEHLADALARARCCGPAARRRSSAPRLG